MKRTVLALILGAAGLAAGYAFFGQVGNRYLDISAILGLEKGLVNDLMGSMVGIGAIRTKILVSGAVGAMAGFLLGKK